MDMMSPTGTERSERARSPKLHSHTAIVFGSAAAHPTRRPASIRATCEAIGLPRSTYYYQSRRSTEAIALEQKLVRRLLELRQAQPNDGYRRMTLQLQLEGIHVNKKRIARLMQLHNLGARATRPDGGVLLHRRLLSALGGAPDTAPNQVWIADLAYVHILSGLIYTAAIIDVWSREVVGYAASTHINAPLPAIALHSAVRAHRPTLGCIHHSTCGIQYLMRGYRELLHQYGLIPAASENTEPPALGGPLCAAPGFVRHIIDMPNYETWDDVVVRADEFVRNLYSPQRIDAILRVHAKKGGASPDASARSP